MLAGLALAGCGLVPAGPAPGQDSSGAAPSDPATVTAPRSAAPTDAATGPVGSRTDFGVPGWSTSAAPRPSTHPPATTRPAEPSTRTQGPAPTSDVFRWRNTLITGRYRQLTWQVQVPRFSGSGDAAELNRRVRASVDDRIAVARREARADDGEARALDGESTVTTNDGRTVQVAIHFVDYLAGTAHPQNWVSTTVVRRDGSPVTLDQVFGNEEAAYRALGPHVRRIAKRRDEPVSEPGGLAPRRQNWAAWQTSRRGVVFFFQDYQLGGFGVRSYTIPWDVVRPLMPSSARALLAPP